MFIYDMSKPEELFEELRPGEMGGWRKLVERRIIPLARLSEVFVKYFQGDVSIRAVEKLRIAANNVITVFEEIAGQVDRSYSVPEDPIDVGEKLLEHAANAFLGVGDDGKYTFLAWSLRKIPREYVLALYPQLGDQAVRERVFKLLGVEELFRPPVSSPLADRLTLLGYPDYPSFARVDEYGDYVTFRILPSKKRTFGGAICRLVDALAAVLARPGILSAYEISIDVLKEYDRLARSQASIPSPYRERSYYLTRVAWRECYRVLREGATLRSDCVNVVEGLGVKLVSSIRPEAYQNVQHESNLLTEFRGWSPCLVLGLAELLFSQLGRFILIMPVERTVEGG